MDADDVAEIIDNNEATSEQVYLQVRAYLLASEAMPGQLNDRPEPGADLATELGETVRAQVLDRMKREHRLTDRERTFTETLIARMMGTVSWSDVGDNYYHTARERYLYEIGERS